MAIAFGLTKALNRCSLIPTPWRAQGASWQAVRAQHDAMVYYLRTEMAAPDPDALYTALVDAHRDLGVIREAIAAARG